MKLRPLIVFVALIALCGTLNGKDKFDPSRPRLNNGIFVGAPDDWRWCRDGISMANFKMMAGEPADPGPQIPGLEPNLLYKSDIEGSMHRFVFDTDGILLFANWYENLKEDKTVKAPKPAIASGLKVLSTRLIPIVWAGEAKTGFQVEVDILLPSGKWEDTRTYITRNTRLIHQHGGANKGRWRVRSLSPKGAGAWSDYVEFSCAP